LGREEVLLIVKHVVIAFALPGI